MFGLPFKNNGMPKIAFKECVSEMLKGPFGSDMKKSLFVPKSDDTYKVYTQINAIQNDESLGEYYISADYYKNKMYRFEVNPGDYIITCDGTLGKHIRLDDKMEPGVISPSLLKIRLDETKVVQRFFEFYWDCFLVDYMVSLSRNTCLMHLPSAAVMGKQEISLPNKEQQECFAAFVQQSDKSKLIVSDILRLKIQKA